MSTPSGALTTAQTTPSTRQQIPSPLSSAGLPPPPAYSPQQRPTTSQTSSCSTNNSSRELTTANFDQTTPSNVPPRDQISGAQIGQEHSHHHHVMRVGQDSSESSISGVGIAGRKDDGGSANLQDNVSLAPPDNVATNPSSLNLYAQHSKISAPQVSHSISTSALSASRTSQAGAASSTAASQGRGVSAEPGLSSFLTENAGNYSTSNADRSAGRLSQNSRRSPDGPRVQAVSPFGVRENQIPPDCTVVKNLYREVAYSSGASAAPAPVTGHTGQPPAHMPSPPAYPGAPQLHSTPPTYNPPSGGSNPREQQQLHSNNISSTNVRTSQQNLNSFGGGSHNQAEPAGLQNMLQQYQALVLQQQQINVAPSSREQQAARSSQPDLSSAGTSSNVQNYAQVQTLHHGFAVAQNSNNELTPTGAHAILAPPTVERANLPPNYGEFGNQQRFLTSNSQPLSNNNQNLTSNSSREQISNNNNVNNVAHSASGGYFYQGARETAANSSRNDVNANGARDDSPAQDVGAHVSTRMIGMLSEDNKNLRQQLEGYIKKTARLQQLELHYQKIHREYEDLVRRQDKREQLESQMRKKMDIETRRYADENRMLRDQIEQLSYRMHQYNFDEQDDSRRHEMAKLNMIIAQLMPQNKELLACKERQEIELQAQRDTLEEQRNHIVILDKALAHTQEKALHLEEQCRQKAMFAQRVEELQMKLHLMHEEMMKREEAHKKARAQLEAEMAQLQIQKAKDSPSLSVKKSSGSLRNGMDLEDTMNKLKRELQEKDEEMLEMKRKLMQWERKYYEDVERNRSVREIEEDSKDLKIKHLEECSDKADRLVEESQTENEKYRGLLREQKGQIATLEQKLQRMEARVAEKEALIKVLRRKKSTGSDSPSISSSVFDDENLSEGNSRYRASGELSFSPLVTRHRLDAAKRRLLQSPSPNRYSRIYHPKFPGSLDTTYCLDDSNAVVDYSSLDRPGRHYKQNDGPSTPTGGTSGLASNTSPVKRMIHHRTESEGTPGSYASGFGPTMGTSAFAKKREIFTLPDLRRGSRPKASSLSQTGKGPRPRSADEHMLAKQEEDCIEEVASERSGDLSFREETGLEESTQSVKTGFGTGFEETTGYGSGFERETDDGIRNAEAKKANERLFHV